MFDVHERLVSVRGYCCSYNIGQIFVLARKAIV